MRALVGTAVTKAMTDAAQEAAGQAGVGIDAYDVGTFGVWMRIVAKAVTGRKGTISSAKGIGTGEAPYSLTISPDAEAGMPYPRLVKEVGAKATGATRKPLVSKGSEVTPEVIQKALQGDPAIGAEGGVSLPAVQRYVDRLLQSDVAPAIKMDGNVSVDGNHRYIAAKILGRNPDVIPGALPANKIGQIKPVSELKVDQVDWGNR